MNKSFIYIIRLSQFVLIPVASFILFCPSSALGILPGSGSLLGIMVLVLASIAVLAPHFSGLKEALMVSTWTALWLTVVFAYEADRMLPATPSSNSKSKAVSLSESDYNTSSSSTLPSARTKKKSDGLEVITFAPEKVVTATPTPGGGLANEVEKAINDVTGAVDKVASEVGLAKDQSIGALPKEAYFPPKETKKKRFGFDEGSSDSGSGSGLIDTLLSMLGIR